MRFILSLTFFGWTLATVAQATILDGLTEAVNGAIGIAKGAVGTATGAATNDIDKTYTGLLDGVVRTIGGAIETATGAAGVGGNTVSQGIDSEASRNVIVSTVDTNGKVVDTFGIASFLTNLFDVGRIATNCDATGFMSSSLSTFELEDNKISAFITIASAFFGLWFCIIKDIAVRFIEVIVSNVTELVQ